MDDLWWSWVQWDTVLPAAVGVQIAHPDKLVVDIAGEASILMTMQEMSTAVQYNLPIKDFYFK